MKLDTRANNQESEAALVIGSTDPKAIVAEVGSLRRLATYRLVRRPKQKIRDSYLDLPDKSLQVQELALRIRETNGGTLITLKGASHLTSFGTSRRFEMERVWSSDALIEVAAELEKRHIRGVQHVPVFLGRMEPFTTMASLGFRIIQQRDTHREVRDILPPWWKGRRALAELVIDSVSFSFGKYAINLYEIEVEEKADNASGVVKAVIEDLLSRYGSTLRKWPHNKLATGKLLERMVGEGLIRDLINGQNNLMPHAFDRLDTYLS